MSPLPWGLPRTVLGLPELSAGGTHIGACSVVQTGKKLVVPHLSGTWKCASDLTCIHLVILKCILFFPGVLMNQHLNI